MSVRWNGKIVVLVYNEFGELVSTAEPLGFGEGELHFGGRIVARVFELEVGKFVGLHFIEFNSY